eukprot:TRINITY_DN5201_c3_g1_i1.p1 TRINITY_DN5201_c3_g1~~TRINITY_DN5201_c3_g1_i1.p1  ORF type:complete len:489 (+),score=102.81 TRINITY_DN5201_c3_g1_i1:193-1659(+)
MFSVSSETMDYVSDVLNAVGLELVIFAITLFCGLTFRVFFPKPVQPKKVHGFKKLASPGGSPVPQQRVPKEVITPEKTVQPQVAQQTPGCNSTSPEELFSETMYTIKEWSNGNVRCANRALTLYLELRRALRENGQKMMAISGSSRSKPIDFYAGIIQIMIRSGKHQQLEAVLDDMVQQAVPRTMPFYESVMKQLASQKLFRQALAVYDKLEADGLTTSAVTYSCLVRFATEIGDSTRAIEFFKKLQSLTTPSIRAYMTVLGVHSKRQDWPSVVATIKDMEERSVFIDSLTLNVALSTGVSADEASSVEEVLAAAEKRKPFVPDVVSYNTLAKVYAQKALGDEAAKLLERMKEHNVAPNAITFNTVMDASVRCGKIEAAWQRLSEMREAGFKPDKFTCSILVKGFVKSCKVITEDTVEKSLQILGEVGGSLDPNLRSNLYHSVAEACVQAEFSTVLMQVLSQMRAHGVTASPALQRSMVNILRSMEKA